MLKHKYLVICLNCAYPTKDDVFFLVTDDDDNTLRFDTENEAREWIKGQWLDGPFSYSIIFTGDFTYE